MPVGRHIVEKSSRTFAPNGTYQHDTAAALSHMHVRKFQAQNLDQNFWHPLAKLLETPPQGA